MSDYFKRELPLVRMEVFSVVDRFNCINYIRTNVNSKYGGGGVSGELILWEVTGNLVFRFWRNLERIKVFSREEFR